MSTAVESGKGGAPDTQVAAKAYLLTCLQLHCIWKRKKKDIRNWAMVCNRLDSCLEHEVGNRY